MDETESADDQIGRVILGRYRLVHLLAKGGMGLIYLARSEGAAGFVKPVVVKRILADFVRDAQMVKMFKREAHIMSNLRHPNIVSVIDFGQERNAYFMVLDYVHGYHLGRWYRFVRATRGLFPFELGIHTMIEVLDALHYAHTLCGPDGSRLGIVHRDVTPSNVLVDVHGHVKLADFGIAQMRAETTEFKTSETTIKGKFPYIAPEVFRGAEPSPVSDVYSAGVVLHELLTGKNEFRTRDVSSTIVRVLQHSASPLRSIRQDIPEAIELVLAKSLAKDPAERYRSAGEFAQALKHVRQRNADEVAEELLQIVRTDFFDPRIAEMADLPRLEQLESIWRNPPKRDPSPPVGEEPEVQMIERLSLEPADLLARIGSASSGRFRSSRRWWFVGALAAMVASVAVVAVLALPKRRSSAPVIMYSGDVAAGDQRRVTEPAPTEPEGSADNAVADEDNEPAVEEPEPEKPRVDRNVAPKIRPQKPLDPYSSALAKYSNQIQDCFARHSQSTANLPRLFIRFEVQTDGTVSKANFVPPSVDQTPLGRCILPIALKTRFPKQANPVALRIPLLTRISR